MTKQQYDQETLWPSKNTTKQQYDQATIWPSNNMTKQHYDQAIIWPSNNVTKQQYDKATIWPGKRREGKLLNVCNALSAASLDIPMVIISSKICAGLTTTPPPRGFHYILSHFEAT